MAQPSASQTDHHVTPIRDQNVIRRRVKYPNPKPNLELARKLHPAPTVFQSLPHIDPNSWETSPKPAAPANQPEAHETSPGAGPQKSDALRTLRRIGPKHGKNRLIGSVQNQRTARRIRPKKEIRPIVGLDQLPLKLTNIRAKNTTP